jgi:hypothetical protein
MANDDTLLWLATVLPLGILIGLAAVQGLSAFFKRHRQSRHPPVGRRVTRTSADR